MILQVNFGISTSDMSTTWDMSTSLRGPGIIYYINDLQKLWYVDLGNVDYPAYLDVFHSPKSKIYLVYVDIGAIFCST